MKEEEDIGWKQRMEKMFEDQEFINKLRTDFLRLEDILRDVFYIEKCVESSHTLLLCTICNGNLQNATKRIKRYEASLPPQQKKLKK